MSLFDMMSRLQEAQAVRLGIQISRQFSDDELADSMTALVDAERVIYGDMGNARLLGRLIPFRVTVTTAAGVEHVHILAPNSCAATIQAVEMLFGIDTDKPQSIKLKVEPITTATNKEA